MRCDKLWKIKVFWMLLYFTPLSLLIFPFPVIYHPSNLSYILLKRLLFHLSYFILLCEIQLTLPSTILSLVKFFHPYLFHFESVHFSLLYMILSLPFFYSLPLKSNWHTPKQYYSSFFFAFIYVSHANTFLSMFPFYSSFQNSTRNIPKQYYSSS